MRKSLMSMGAAAAALLLIPLTVADAAPGGANWTNAGGDYRNTRSQPSESKLTISNVSGLTKKWEFTTGGDVSATPAVYNGHVYVPDWAGNLYAINAKTGAQEWRTSIPAASGVPFDKARATPTVTESLVIVGTQGSILAPGGGPGGKVMAFSRATGELVWSTVADAHPAAIITQSPTVFNGLLYVGVASQEEALAAFVPGYELSFRGSMLAIDVATGAIVWKTYMAPTGYTGNAVWGSSPAIDTKRHQVLIATGNNYSVPPEVLECVKEAGSSSAQAACLPANDFFDSILALDLTTGAVKWVTRAIPYDAWTVDCIPFFGDGDLCPDPAGPDYDFGQAPSLFTVKPPGGKSVDVVGAGQKSGQYWALDAATGAVRWVTQAGPGGTAGGLQWGSAVDRGRIYTANANSNLVPWTLPGGAVTTAGVWSGLDAVTGQVLWQKTPPHGGGTSGPVTTANGIVFGCSLDPAGHMYAMNGATGAILWEFASGGSCLSGAAISNGTVYWGSGYSNFGFGTPNNKLYAFGLPN
ncbi:PQQ-binding-like beta-propeller repeat protein [Nocardioides sp. GCM10030258]|uniref:outer membrane protein assembly factor BamB family protein n=1 Tax=unclassified Nocardioides TaxID=2615069 RepID=UPI00361678F9